MDYEKKYKEALERARVWKEKSGMPKDKQGILDDIFPELKESEDEKLRKWCISHFRGCFRITKDNAEYKEYINNKVIPWLEKKGEKKPAWSEGDENYHRICLDLCTGMPNGGVYAPYIKDEAINWLKSLKNRYTWKPSAFHLECIEDAISLYEKRGINAIGLKEILEELKKLKE